MNPVFNPIFYATSTIGLAATLIPSALFFVGYLDHDTTKLATSFGTIIWVCGFVGAPCYKISRRSYSS